MLFASCNKEIDLKEMPISSKSSTINIAPEGFFIKDLKIPGVSNNKMATSRQSAAASSASSSNTAPEPNNGDDPIILGEQLPNPYTVANMQQSVNILYGGNYPINATHYYVRFKPNSVEQFVTLEDAEDLELQDYPMDYEVIQDGDYWQDPAQGTEAWQWLYTVVPVTYSFPIGIQKEIIESLYLPNNNETLEDMAESIAGGAQYRSTKQNNSNNVTIERTDVATQPFNYSGEQCACEIIDECPVWPDCGNTGGNGGGTGSNPKIPKGTIQVQDIRTCNLAATPITNVAVRTARIVCKRWFKIERSYTNDQGNFAATKKFKNKTKVVLKTKNEFAKVSKVRGARLWQLLFPFKKRIGVFDEGAMANISYLFTKPTPTTRFDRELVPWVAVTTHNSVIEYRQYASEFGIALPPTKVNLLVTNWGFQRGAGAAPMWKQCSSLSSDFSTFQEFIEFYIAGATFVSQVNIYGYLKNQMDVIIGYAAPLSDYDCRLTSADIKSIAYHELGHTSHYAQAGCDYWQAYRVRIANELGFGNPIARPYGDGSETNAGVVAIGEMWGTHCEKIFSNRHYGNGNIVFGSGGTFISRLQGEWTNGNGLNANLNAIENFNPTINQLLGTLTDPHQWIPQGLPYDLIDERNDFNFNQNLPVDNVQNYTTGQIFNGLQPQVRTVNQFRTTLLQQNNNNQAAEVNNLFSRYGY